MCRIVSIWLTVLQVQSAIMIIGMVSRESLKLNDFLIVFYTLIKIMQMSIIES